MDQALPHVLEIVQRRRWPAVLAFSSVLCGVAIYLALTPRLYQARVRLLLDSRPATSISPLGRDIASQTGQGDKSLATQEELAKSTKVLAKSIELYQQNWGTSIPPLTEGQVKSDLQVLTVPGTEILELSYSSEDPDLSANLLNIISEQVVENNVDSIRAEAQATRKFLDTQVPKKKQELALAEAAISDFKQLYGIVSLDELDSKRLSENIATTQNLVEELTAQLRQLEARSSSIGTITEAQNSSDSYRSVRAGQDQELEALRTKLSSLNNQIVTLRQNLSDGHPQLQALISERDETQLIYEQKLAQANNTNISAANPATDQVSQDLSLRYILGDVERQEIAEKLKATQAHLDVLNAQRRQFPELEQTYAKLNRRKESAAESLKLLENKLDEAKIAESQLLSNLEIIEPAKVPGSPSSPKMAVTLILGMIVGVLQAVGIVLLLEGLDRTIHNEMDVENLGEIPVLGVLPKLPKKLIEHGITQEDIMNNPLLVESYRSLLQSIKFRAGDECARVIITSSVNKEGKSIVASRLAAVAALYSRKTLLIDADFSHPSQHSIFKLNLTPGLQDYLLGTRHLSEIIHRTSIENLSVATVGGFYDNASTFFESGSMSSFIAEAAKKFEFIVIDTPSIGTSIDAVTLCDMSDSFLIVARPDFTKKDVLMRTTTELISHGIQSLGVVLNGLKTKLT